MIPVKVTLQYLSSDGVKNSASMRLSMDMTITEAIRGIVEYLNLPDEGYYQLLRQRRPLDSAMRLFEAGIQEGDILQLTVLDANATITGINIGLAGGILSRLGGKAGDEPLPVRAALIAHEGQSFMLRHTRALIGRADERLGFPPESLDADLTPLDPGRAVSRPHAMIVYAEGGFTIRDLFSQSGLTLNGQRVSPSGSQPIHDGDMLSFGGVVLQFRCES
jgi:hypothetical protein